MVDWRALSLTLIERLYKRLDDVPGSDAEQQNTFRICLILDSATLDVEALRQLRNMVR